MIIITTTDNGTILQLGRQGEKNARQVWFDLTWLIENFGEGTAELRHQRSKDGAPYIVTNAVRESNRLVWTISRTDVAYDGFGKAEIVWTVTGTDTEAKTVVYRTYVLASLAAETEVPDPYESWYDTMIDYIDQLKVDSDAWLVEAVESASKSATDAAESATQASESEATATAKATQAAQSASDATQSATNAATSAAESAANADRAEQAAANSGYMFFYINENGDLIYQRTENVEVDFYLSNGDLYVRAET